MPAVIFAIIIVLGGGTAFAADGSVPGEPLYSFKTGINEKVRSAFAVSDESEAELEVDLAENRLRESEELAVSGRLNSENSADLEARFKNRIERARAEIRELEADGRTELAARLSSRLESILNGHLEILSSLEAKQDLDADSRAEVRNLLNSLRLEHNMSAENRQDIEARIETGVEAAVGLSVAAEQAERSAERVISRAESLLDKLESKISSEARAEAEAKIETAKTVKANAEATAEAGNSLEAIHEFHRAQRKAQRAFVLLRAGQNLNLEINSRANLDSGEEKSESSEDQDEGADEEEQENEDQNENVDDSDGNEAGVESESRADIEVDVNSDNAGASAELRSENSLRSEN